MRIYENPRIFNKIFNGGFLYILVKEIIVASLKRHGTGPDREVGHLPGLINSILYSPQCIARSNSWVKSQNKALRATRCSPKKEKYSFFKVMVLNGVLVIYRKKWNLGPVKCLKGVYEVVGPLAGIVWHQPPLGKTLVVPGESQWWLCSPSVPPALIAPWVQDNTKTKDLHHLAKYHWKWFSKGPKYNPIPSPKEAILLQGHYFTEKEVRKPETNNRSFQPGRR